MPNGPAAAIGIELGARAGVHTPVQRLRLRRRGDRLRLRHDPQPAAPTSWSPAAPRPRSTRCRSPASPRCRRSRRATTPPRPRRARTTSTRDGFVLGEGAAVARPRDRGARQGPRRQDLRRARRRRDHVATRTTSPRPTPRAPAPSAPCRGGPRERRRSRRRRRPHQRARDVDAGRRHRRGQGAPRRARRRDRRHPRLGDEVDDRPPARCGRRDGGDLHDPGRSTTGSPRRRSTSTSSTRRSRSTSSGKDPRPLPDGDVVALNNSFGFGGHNVVLAFRNA